MNHMDRIDRRQFVSYLDAAQLVPLLEAAAAGNRLSGSRDEAEVFDWAEEHLRDLGFSVDRFAATSLIGLPHRAAVEVLSPVELRLSAKGYSMSPGTGSDGVTGELVDVGNGSPSEYPAGGLAGRVAISTGIPMPDKIPASEASGAVAHIHVNAEHIHEMCISPVWGAPTPAKSVLLPSTPAVGISGSDGARLRELLSAGSAVVRVTTDSSREWREIPVLTAELEGTEYDSFVLFSGHVDSWHRGALDNASGTAAQLAIGELAAERRDQLKRGLRLAFWSGHSHGRYAGSAWYADHHWQDLYDRCVCHLNVDSIGGSGADVLSDAPTMAETYGFGAQVVRELTGRSLSYRRMPRAGDQSFWGIGIPSLFSTMSEQSSSGPMVEEASKLLGGGVQKRGKGFGWWWHTEEDTVDKVDMNNLVRDTSIYAAAIWDLCTLPTLPFNYAAAAREAERDLADWDSTAGSGFDLSGEVLLAGELATRVEDLIGGQPPPRVLDEVWRMLGRALIPVAYTELGPFDQDPALGVPPFPGLVGIRRLVEVERGDDEWHMVETQLVRNRNRIRAALLQALRAVQAAREA